MGNSEPEIDPPLWPEVTPLPPSKYYSNPRCFQLGESWKVFRRLFPKDEQGKPWVPEPPQVITNPNDSDPTDKFIALVQHTVHRFAVESKDVYYKASSEEERVLDRRIGLVIIILHEVFSRCRDSIYSSTQIHTQILASLSEFLADDYVQYVLHKALRKKVEDLFKAQGLESVLHAYEWLTTMGPYAHSCLAWRFRSKEGTHLEFDWALSQFTEDKSRYYKDYADKTALPSLEDCTTILHILVASLHLGNIGDNIFLLPSPRVNGWEVLGPWDDETGYPTRNDCDSFFLPDLTVDYKELLVDKFARAEIEHFEGYDFIRRYDRPAQALDLDAMDVDP